MTGMGRFFTFLWAVIIGMAVTGCGHSGRYDALQRSLEEYVHDKDANIGIAVISGDDTIAVNGHRRFPMLSVYKFPIAMAVAENCRVKKIDFSDSCFVMDEDLHRDTYSPMLAEYPSVGPAGKGITIDKLLRYALQESDNNASDILVGWVDSPALVDEYVAWLGIDGMDILWTEAEMYERRERCYENSSTPVAMAALMAKFDNEFNDSLSVQVKRIMEQCRTGADRLAGMLPADSVTIGHKTGTGFTLPDGRLMAINDAGYVHLPDGRRYAIAVFVENSGYDMAATSKIIAEISAMVYRVMSE